ncbi:uncharacterized protein LOC135933912 [Cloeon dipterum]|uniref:uncharacterized protein LOC135933912 n=1 Tax=Cloeon dipterum TaxID=197152 RepID=UPI00322062C0
MEARDKSHKKAYTVRAALSTVGEALSAARTRTKKDKDASKKRSINYKSKEHLENKNRKLDIYTDSVNLNEKVKTKKTASPARLKMILLLNAILITGVGASLAFNSIMVPKTRVSLEIGSYNTALISKVIGQDAAIAEILKTLPVLYQNAKDGELRVMLLSGGSGVGKDLVAQAMTAEFYAQSRGDCKESSYLLLNYNGPICKRTDFNMIRLDTIANDVDILEAVELIRRISSQGIRGILLVPVLAAKALDAGANGLQNVKTIESYKAIVKRRSSEIQELLELHGVKSEMIVFEPVSRDILIKCLHFPGENVVNYVMNDREFSLSGCKYLEEFSMIE